MAEMSEKPPPGTAIAPQAPGPLATAGQQAYTGVNAVMNAAYQTGQGLPPGTNPLGPLSYLPMAWVYAHKAYDAFTDWGNQNTARAGGLAGALETSDVADPSALVKEPQPIEEQVAEWPPPIAAPGASGPLQSVTIPEASMDPGLALGGESWASGWAG